MASSAEMVRELRDRTGAGVTQLRPAPRNFSAPATVQSWLWTIPAILATFAARMLRRTCSVRCYGYDAMDMPLRQHRQPAAPDRGNLWSRQP